MRNHSETALRYFPSAGEHRGAPWGIGYWCEQSQNSRWPSPNRQLCCAAGPGLGKQWCRNLKCKFCKLSVCCSICALGLVGASLKAGKADQFRACCFSQLLFADLLLKAMLLWIGVTFLLLSALFSESVPDLWGTLFMINLLCHSSDVLQVVLPMQPCSL